MCISAKHGGGVGWGGGMTHKPNWTLCEQLVWFQLLFLMCFYASSFSHMVF